MSFTESQVPLPDEVDGPVAGVADHEPDPASPYADSPAGPSMHADDPDDEWAVSKTSRGIRLGVITGVLLLLVAAAGGFWGGAAVEKNHAASTASSSASSALSRFAAAARSAASGSTGSAGTGASLFGGRGGFGAAASGTVIGVSGDVLELSNSSGSIVKVIVGGSATVTRTSPSSLSGLKIGDTVTVSGSTASNGTVTATGVRATAPGAATAATGSGFNGGGSLPGG